MQLACEYLETVWPKPNMEVETDFRIVRYKPLPGGEQESVFSAKGSGLPEHNFFDVTLEGRFVKDDRYGDTFVVKSFHTAVKRTRANVLGYLASGVIKGVGPSIAKKIVEHFGVEALEILEQNPERLREVSGIGEKVLEDITGSFVENREINALMLYVGQYYADDLGQDGKAKSPISKNKAKRIVTHFGERALEIVQSDIYHLCEVDGFGFITVDAMAEKMKKPMNTLPRVKAAAMHILKENRQKNGHLYMVPEDFLKELKRNLNHKKATFQFRDDVLRPLANEVLLTKQIAYHNRSVYLTTDFQNEKVFAERMAIRLFLDRDAQNLLPHPALVSKGIYLSPEQEQAAVTALTRNTCIITGGPGTGKTTVVRTILDSFTRLYPNKDGILLCAPTGRAAKRLSETTGYPAYTVHKAFGLWSEDHEGGGESTKKLDVVIMDEVSMVDMWMAAQIVTHISPETKLIMVGDAAQLPSVGPGNVLHEMIASEIVPTVQLKQVFRQADGSSIALNAQLINQADTNLVFDDEFTFVPAKNQEEAMFLVCALYRRAVNALGLDRVQILTPVRKDGHKCGVNHLNTAIQGLMQPYPELGYRHYDRYYCAGDPVMQIKNADGIYNGEIGVVSEVEPDKLQILFAGSEKPIPYEDEKLNLLDLAYALTVHKSQGSEYSCVIVPVLKEHKFMLGRNLLYTAITRGKNRVIIVGNRWALGRAILTEDTSKRHTHLAMRMRACYAHLLETAQNIHILPDSKPECVA